jgi:hypothetical protein
MHSAFNDIGIVHPVDQTLSGGDEMSNYNAYITSGKMTGSSTTAYLSIVPFCSDNERNLATLKAQTLSKAGPTASYSTVGCFSCHRAHASGFDSITRWENGHEFLTVLDSSNNIVYPAIDTTPSMPDQAEGRLAAEKQQAYYGRPASMWGGYQRVLCNKCHAKD